MIKLKVLQILKEKNKSKYWLWNQLNISYQNFDRMIKNQTSSIKYKNLELLCEILDCTPNDLFEFTED